MFRFLFILFIVVPIIEIMVLMNVGAWLGVWPTIAIVIITAWLGAKNVKQQDFDDRIDVLPVADPNIFSMSQRITMAQTE